SCLARRSDRSWHSGPEQNTPLPLVGRARVGVAWSLHSCQSLLQVQFWPHPDRSHQFCCSTNCVRSALRSSDPHPDLSPQGATRGRGTTLLISPSLTRSLVCEGPAQMGEEIFASCVAHVIVAGSQAGSFPRTPDKHRE